MTDLTKRIILRVTDEQLAWIGQMAADEGMDNSTFVRVVIDRLSKGRAPLISMMGVNSDVVRRERQALDESMAAQVAAYSAASRATRDENALVNVSDAADLLAERAAQVEASVEQQPEEPYIEPTAAIPLRKAARGTLYNPGRN